MSPLIWNKEEQAMMVAILYETINLKAKICSRYMN